MICLVYFAQTCRACLLMSVRIIVELLHQRVIQDADMTCAMDWYHPGGKDAPPLFYDVWISREFHNSLLAKYFEGF